MGEIQERKDRLVDYLEALAGREERGTLATLRRAFEREHSLDGLAVVLPFVSNDPRWRNRAEDDGLLVAGLFALHPEAGSIQLPEALRRLSEASGSVELRFRALLSTSREDLPEHLRHAVALVAGHGLPIDWRHLHESIRFWDHASERTKRQWARAFWNAAAPNDAAEPSA